MTIEPRAPLTVPDPDWEVRTTAQDPLELDHVPPGASILSMATHRLSRLMRAQLSNLLASEGDLSLVDWRICVALSQREAVPQKALVDYAKMEQAHVSRSLSLMQARGLITSRRSDRDRRIWLYSLTQEGHDRFREVLPAVSARCRAIDDTLSPEEREQFLDMTRRLAVAARCGQKETGSERQSGRPKPNSANERTKAGETA